MCRQGASAIQSGVLEAEGSDQIAVFVVWVPVLKMDRAADAETLALVPDPRAAHFWDQAYTAGSLFRNALALPEEVRAWDVYLLYDQDARWEGEPPQPAYWQHQLGERVLALAPALDPPALLQRVRQLLSHSD